VWDPPQACQTKDRHKSWKRRVEAGWQVTSLAYKECHRRGRVTEHVTSKDRTKHQRMELKRKISVSDEVKRAWLTGTGVPLNRRNNFQYPP
jgi:hypothetical protein